MTGAGAGTLFRRKYSGQSRPGDDERDSGQVSSQATHKRCGHGAPLAEPGHESIPKGSITAAKN